MKDRISFSFFVNEIFLHQMSSNTGGGAPCPRDDDCDTSPVVAAQIGDGGAAPISDGISPDTDRPKDTCPEISLPIALPPTAATTSPTKADWPSDLLYKLLVQSGVTINCGKTTQGISSQSTRGSNQSFGNGTIEIDGNNLAGANNFTTRPDDLISAVLEHILPGLKKSTSPCHDECKDANKIPWDINRDGYTSSTLEEIKEAASARFALSVNKESNEHGEFRLAIMLLLHALWCHIPTSNTRIHMHA